MNQKRIEDFGINIGSLKKGPLNKISDVEGIRVGHSTIEDGENRTGVTVLLPMEDNIYKYNLVAASHVINGYGKTTGLIQVDELGSLESIIAMTNTMNVGLVQDAIVDYTVNRCNREGVEIKSYNPVVCECNDSFLNDIRNRVVGKKDVYQAIENAEINFLEGDIGAGKGMSCYQLKGGIGSASRMVELDGKEYTLGSMVLSNFGELEDLIIDGEEIGRKLYKELKLKKDIIEGSVIIILATDAPMTSRQVKRLCKRAGLGLAKTGSYVSNGSGDIVLGFSTANRMLRQKENERESFQKIKVIRDDMMNDLFRAVVETVEESVLNSMITAKETVGYEGNRRLSLKDYIDYLK